MTKPKPDGDLPAAKRRLDAAVGELTDPRTRIIEGRKRHAPSLYIQLCDTITGLRDNGWNGAHQSQPPVYVDAFDLINEIDTAVECWQPQPAGVPVTVGRLHALQDRSWRPQDVRNINQITDAVQAWVKQIQNLLDPERTKEIRDPNGDGYAACPQCERKTTYRTDPVDGESKRVPVLQWQSGFGTTCIVCRAYWAPDRTLFLGLLLGFELPAGVLEGG